VVTLTGPDGDQSAVVAAPVMRGEELPAAGPEASGPPPAGLSLWWGLLAAVAGGLALAAAFPPVGLWPLAPVGPALLVVALWRRGLKASALTGLVFGLAFFVPLLSWLVNVAWYVWLALALAEAVVFAVLAVAQRVLLGLRAWQLAVAGWWVAAEAVRARWPYAFPWGRLAMSQAGSPAAPWASVGGAPLLSFLIALAGATLAWLLLAPRWPVAVPALSHAADSAPPGAAAPRQAAIRRRLVPAAGLAVVTGLALAGPLLGAGQIPAGTPATTVAAVQGNVPHARNLPDVLRETTVTANHAAATRGLAASVRAGTRPAPSLVVWPENSTDIDPVRYPPVYATISGAVAAIGRPVLVGEVLQGPQRNAGQLWSPGKGPGGLYVKRQLVPFGEYIPFRGLLAHITPLVALQPHDFVPGHRAVVFRTGAIRLGDVICYEVGFDGLVSSEVKAGANLLAVQTNDADFELDGQLGETEQQLAMARIRAVETGRAVVYASTTGESAIIAPGGALLARSGTWRQAVLEARVPLLSRLTLADRLGAWPEALAVLLTAAALAWATASSLARKRAATGRRRPSPRHPG
jgi:apolipoprotein N-acyltransferase